ncbi:aquaporin-10-like [Tropilaelaps mercedesae]|uniref:Aquaporin-10-like n=1 Tax=Tropilaelaps mercedesae TaxID=418985 RepID=A0A1V9X077_9ACAR|nr:aquaporin-10-like [Tropilaelaps mercedesae]
MAAVIFFRCRWKVIVSVSAEMTGSCALDITLDCPVWTAEEKLGTDSKTIAHLLLNIAGPLNLALSGVSNTFLSNVTCAGGVFFGMITAMSNSGAHLNPMVTTSFAARGIFPWKKVPHYIFAQYVEFSHCPFAIGNLVISATSEIPEIPPFQGSTARQRQHGQLAYACSTNAVVDTLVSVLGVLGKFSLCDVDEVGERGGYLTAPTRQRSVALTAL